MAAKLFVFKRGSKVPQLDPTNGMLFLYISQASPAYILMKMAGKGRKTTQKDGQQPRSDG